MISPETIIKAARELVEAYDTFQRYRDDDFQRPEAVRAYRAAAENFAAVASDPTIEYARRAVAEFRAGRGNATGASAR